MRTPHLTPRAAAATGAGLPSVLRGVDLDARVALRLAGDEASLERLWRSPIVTEAATPGTAHQMAAGYYDTAALRLRKRGITLRVGFENGRWVQRVSVRTDDPPRIDVATLESDQPDVRRIADPVLRERIGLVLPGDLEPLFTLRIERRERVVEFRDGAESSLLRLLFDRGEIAAHGETARIGEIGIELLRGDGAAPCRLAARLFGVTPFRIEWSDAVARGFALGTDEMPTVRFGDELRLDPEVSLEHGVASVLRGCTEHWTGNMPAALDGRDPEGVHQVRVGLRRLRTALGLLRRTIDTPDIPSLDGAARQLLRTFGAARDWDVFLSELLPPLEAGRPTDAALLALRAEAERARAKAYDDARAYVNALQSTRFFLALGEAIEGREWRSLARPEAAADLARPMVRIGDDLLDKRYAKTMRKGHGFAHMKPETRHELRITLKKLRYLAEFFAPLHPGKRTHKYLRALKRMQDSLGAMNDVRVAEQRLLALIRESSPDSVRDIRMGAGLVIGWYARLGAEADGKANARWAAFADAKPFWRPD